MANRRVSVFLELDTSRFNRSAVETVAALKGTKAMLKEFGDEADDASVDLEQLAANTVVAKHEVDDLGDEARGSAADLALLDAKIKDTETSVRRLGLEFARTGGTLVAGQLDDERALLGKLRRVRKELSDLDVDIDNVLTGRDRGIIRFPLPTVDASQFVSEMRGTLIIALVGAIIAASPMIAAAITGAVTGAIGTVAVAGAIGAASKDPQVRAAARQFGSVISSEFFEAGSSALIVQPILQALELLKQGFRDLNLQETFLIASPYIEAFARGIADAGRVFMPEFNAALQASRPALTVLAQMLPTVAFRLAQMFRTIAESPGAAEGMKFLLGLVNATFMAIGGLVRWLTDRFSEAVHRLAEFTGILEDIPLPGFAEKAGGANDALERFIAEADASTLTTADLTRGLFFLGAEAEETGDSVGYLDEQLQTLLESQYAIVDAELAWEQALDDLAESVQNNGNTLDKNTQAGRDNARALLDGLRAAQEYRQQMIDNGATLEEADRVYAENVERLLDQAEKFGLARKRAEEYIAVLKSIPLITSAINEAKLTIVHQIQMALTGFGSGFGGGGSTWTPPTVTPQSASGFQAGEPFVPLPPPPPSTSGFQARQHGGPMSPFGTYLMGEHRPEVVQMGSMGGFAYPSVDAWGAAMGGDGAYAPEIRVYIGDQELRGMVRVEVRERDRETKRSVQGRFRRSSIEERS